MKLANFLPLVGSTIGLVQAIPYGSHSDYLSVTFENKTVFSPPENYNIPRVLYARSVELSSGVLLSTWENYSPEPPLVYFPIYESSDSGLSWTHISNVTDKVNGWGMRYQPFLYQLTQRFGNYEEGTILAAGNSIPTDLSQTQIDLYASKDQGRSWTFVSHIASGGEALPDNGLTPVWEPFIMEYDNQLVVYYSDQRDPDHGQKLVHQTSRDLVHWGRVIDDCEYSEYTARPGMTTVAKLPNGSYIFTYEYGGGPGFSGYTFPVYYRINKNPLKFNESTGIPIVASSGEIPISSPTVTWSPSGGPNGTIIASCGSSSLLYLNRELGDPNAWKTVSISEDYSYTRYVKAISGARLLVIGGGHLGGTSNTVHMSILSMADLIAMSK
ncbi:putative glycoside hydrolase [Dipodascopsis uninucleata]